MAQLVVDGRELEHAVDARAAVDVGLVDRHGASLEQRDGVGQVALALGVVRLDPGKRLGERRRAERVDADVDRGDLELVGARVARLDDALDGRAGAHDAPVGVRRRDAGDRERAVDALLLTGLAHGPDGLGADRRRVARQHEHVLGAARERGEPDLDRVARAVRGLLHRDPHLGERGGHRVGDRRGHHDDDIVGSGLERRGHDPGEHRRAAQIVQDLGLRGAHARPEAPGHDDRARSRHRRSRGPTSGLPGQSR